MVVKRYIVGSGVVSGVEVVGISREFSSKGVDFLHERSDSEVLPARSDFVFGRVDGLGNLFVRETHLLRFHH